MPLVMSSSSIVVTWDHLRGSLNDWSIVQIFTDRGVEVERVGRALALLVEEQDAEGGERLRHRTDVEPGVGLDGRAGRHVAEPVSLRQGDLPVGDDRHGDAGDLVLIEVGFQGLRDAVGQVGRRGRVGHTKVARGHEQARIERLGLGPRPPSCAPSGPIGRPGGADPVRARTKGVSPAVARRDASCLSS